MRKKSAKTSLLLSTVIDGDYCGLGSFCSIHTNLMLSISLLEYCYVSYINKKRNDIIMI